MTETITTTPESVKWEPLTPEQVRDLLGDKVLWFIAGGWALDLFLGRPTRAHNDIEIAVFREDGEKVRVALKSWEIFIAHEGTLTRWDRGPLPADAHELWARESGKDSWQIEILVEERNGERWAYRRDPDIGVRAADLGRMTADGIRYIRPEIQLLYKSAGSRPADESDFLTVLPRLDAAQKAFLSAALWTTSPGHRWLGRLT